MRPSDRSVSVSVRSYPARYRHGEITADGSYGKLKMEPGLLVEMFHRSSTEEDEDTDPECGSLKGDCLIGLPSLFVCIIGLEEHCVEEQREETKGEKKLNKKDGQVFGMVLNPAAGLQGDGLIDVVKIDATGK